MLRSRELSCRLGALEKPEGDRKNGSDWRITAFRRTAMAIPNEEPGFVPAGGGEEWTRRGSAVDRHPPRFSLLHTG